MLRRKRGPRNGADSTLFRVGICGEGSVLELLAGIIGQGVFAETFPGITVVGRIAGQAGKKLPPLPGKMGKVQRYASVKEFFEDHPDCNVILDLDGSRREEIRQYAPAGVTMLGAEVVNSFCQSALDGSMIIGGGARLRRARDMFAILINQLDEDVIILDATGRIIEVNQHVLDRKGGRKSDYIGRLCQELDGEDLCCGTGAVCPWREAAGISKRIHSTVHKVTEDGKLQYFRIYAFPLTGEDGLTRRMVLMRRDITERVHIEQRLQQSEKMAAIGELSTYIAHEIRNPLFAIGGFANSLLRAGDLSESSREKAKIILEESHRLDAILKSILNFARPMDQSLGDVDVREVLEQTVGLMSLGDEAKGIKTVLKVAPGLPKITGNPDQLKQCFINLVKNSQEAMRDGGTLTLSAYLESGRVVLTVEDTGCGIPPELHETIFNPFFSTKDKGAGLGLAMTKKIVEELGGSVSVFSKPGQGTKFIFHLKPALAVENKEQTNG